MSSKFLICLICLYVIQFKVNSVMLRAKRGSSALEAEAFGRLWTDVKEELGDILETDVASGRRGSLLDIECSNVGGCHKGYCWTGCYATFVSYLKPEWCYTTRGRSQDFNYIRCTKNSQCNVCWKCAGSCTI